MLLNKCAQIPLVLKIVWENSKRKTPIWQTNSGQGHSLLNYIERKLDFSLFFSKFEVCFQVDDLSGHLLVVELVKARKIFLGKQMKIWWSELFMIDRWGENRSFRNNLDLDVTAVYSLLLSVKVIVTAIVSVVISGNDVLKMEAQSRVNGGHATGVWPREKISFELLREHRQIVSKTL